MTYQPKNCSNTTRTASIAEIQIFVRKKKLTNHFIPFLSKIIVRSWKYTYILPTYINFIHNKATKSLFTMMRKNTTESSKPTLSLKCYKIDNSVCPPRNQILRFGAPRDLKIRKTTQHNQVSYTSWAILTNKTIRYTTFVPNTIWVENSLQKQNSIVCTKCLQAFKRNYSTTNTKDVSNRRYHNITKFTLKRKL